MNFKTGLPILLLLATPTFASSVYWYDGDPNFMNYYIDGIGIGGGNNSALVYDEFVVGPDPITITGMFSNDSLNAVVPASVTDAYWEIRTGLSTGNAGTLVDSGTDAVTLTDTGEDFAGEIYTIQADGLDVTLAPGTYWLAFAPIIMPGGDTYIDLTSGTNGVSSGGTLDGGSYFTSADYGSYFVPEASYSEGIVITPEPHTFALMGGAFLLAAFFRKGAKSLTSR